jgi:hypothetical protein
LLKYCERFFFIIENAVNIYDLIPRVPFPQ